MKIIIILIAIILITAISGILFWKGIYTPLDVNNNQTVSFKIKNGQSSKQVAENLKKQNLINSEIIFNVYALFSRNSKSIKAGEYELSFSMTIPQIIEKIVSGQVVKEKITIIEGWNLKEISEYFKEKGIEGADSLDPLLEGYLFPDTYEIFSGIKIEEIIEKMQDNFKKKLTPELREQISSQEKTISEIITMASLLEKEVISFQDKKIVSGILWKRIKIGMPLQVDATICYITGKKTTSVLIEETRIDSPYNTYKYRGLPKGPICNPGIESIIAAIQPQDSQYLYYLSTKEGKNIFNRTLEEHNIAKAKYLK